MSRSARRLASAPGTLCRERITMSAFPTTSNSSLSAWMARSSGDAKWLQNDVRFTPAARASAR